MSGTAHESNLFGLETTGVPALPEPASDGTTEAQKLTDHIKWIADNYLTQAAARADWLAIAANAGQNGDAQGFVKREYVEPATIDPGTVLAAWGLKLPDVPALKSLPALPPELSLDFDKIHAGAQTDLGDLQTSWMATFIPTLTDVTPLNKLIDSVLGGTSETAFQQRLTTLEQAVTVALGTIKTTALGALTTDSTAAKTNVAGYVTANSTNVNTEVGNLEQFIDATRQTTLQNLQVQSQAIQVALGGLDNSIAASREQTGTNLGVQNQNIAQTLATLYSAISTARTAVTVNLGIQKDSVSQSLATLNSAIVTSRSQTLSNLTVQKTNVAAALSDLNTSLTTAKASIATAITTQGANVASALALAKDNTQEIAWTRGRDQVAREAARAEEETISQWASRGFSLPPGVLLNQIQGRKQQTLNSASDIAAQEATRIQQAFLDIAKTTVEAWQHALDVQSRTDTESYRAFLDASRSTIESWQRTLEIQNRAEVDNYRATLDAARSAIESWQRTLETQNRAEVDNYRATLDAAKGAIEAWQRTLETQNRAEVDNYRAVLDAGRTSVEAAQKTLDVQARTEAENTRARLDAARTNIEAWGRAFEIQSRTEVENYKTSIDSYLRYSQLEADANKFNAELAVKDMGLVLDFTKFAAEEAVKYRLGIINGINDLIRAYAAQRGTETEYLRGIATAKAQAMGALTEYYRAALQSADIGLRIEMTNKDNAHKYIQIASQFIGNAVGHYVNAAGLAANAFAHVAGSAVSGLNAVATQS